MAWCAECCIRGRRPYSHAGQAAGWRAVDLILADPSDGRILGDNIISGWLCPWCAYRRGMLSHPVNEDLAYRQMTSAL